MASRIFNLYVNSFISIEHNYCKHLHIQWIHVVLHFYQLLFSHFSFSVNIKLCLLNMVNWSLLTHHNIEFHLEIIWISDDAFSSTLHQFFFIRVNKNHSIDLNNEKHSNHYSIYFWLLFSNLEVNELSSWILILLWCFVWVAWSFCWHEKPRWFASWRFDEDWMKLFWTILKPLTLEWSLHWWRKGDLMISMVIKAGMCALHVLTSLRKCACSL